MTFLRPFAAAFLVALPVQAGAQALGTQQTIVGSSVRRLLVGALRHIQGEGWPDACFVGLAATVNIYHDSPVPGNKSGYYNSYEFYFYSPTKPFVAVKVSEPVDSGPLDSRLGTFNTYSTDVLGQGVGVQHPPEYANSAEFCIADIPIDSGPALVAASKAGLPFGNGNAFGLHLRHAAGPVNVDWADKALRRKLFWIVFEGDIPYTDQGLVTAVALDFEQRRQYLIDAVSGHLLKKRRGIIQNQH